MWVCQIKGSALWRGLGFMVTSYLASECCTHHVRHQASHRCIVSVPISTHSLGGLAEGRPLVRCARAFVPKPTVWSKSDYTRPSRLLFRLLMLSSATRHWHCEQTAKRRPVVHLAPIAATNGELTVWPHKATHKLTVPNKKRTKIMWHCLGLFLKHILTVTQPLNNYSFVSRDVPVTI